MVRAGVGYVRLVDDDCVVLNNLQRQTLFDERDARDARPKVLAAAEKLTAINREVTIEPIQCRAQADNLEKLVDGANLILDGTDNLESRYASHDIALNQGIPWIYAACLADHSVVMPVRPGGKPCLRCLYPAPPEQPIPTCVQAGILGPAVTVTASFAAAEAFKILTGHWELLSNTLLSIDLWRRRLYEMPTDSLAQGCDFCRGL